MSSTEEVKKEENGSGASEKMESEGSHSSPFIGQPPTFDHTSTEGFSFFHNRLKTFFSANDISSPEKMKAIFLTCLADKTYKLLDGLCTPESPDNVGFEELMVKFNTFFNPKSTNPHFSARLNFYTARKRAAESFNEWAKRLGELAAECNFGDEKSYIIRDLFVVGLGDSTIRSRLLEEDPTGSETTLDHLIQLATTAEAVKNIDGANANRSKCSVCGMANHNSTECRYKGLTCSACGEHGHIAPGCPQRAKIKTNKRQSLKRYGQNPRRFIGNQGSRVGLNMNDRNFGRPFRSNYNNPY